MVFNKRYYREINCIEPIILYTLCEDKVYKDFQGVERNL